MLQVPQRTALSGPTLVRLVARLCDVNVPESTQSLSDRLSEWLGWTDAIALSTVLNGNSPAAASGAPVNGADGADAQSLCARVRAALANAIAGDSAFGAARRDGRAKAVAPEASTDDAAGYAEYRQRYLSMQQAMETDIGTLRGLLRAMLAVRGSSMARLAAVDAIMERALSSRERSLLASVPALLERHFERLRKTEQQTLADAEASWDAVAVTPGAWLTVFRGDMRSVLLAELEVRFQPVQGLLAALCAS